MCVLLRWVPGRFVDDGLTPSHLERVGAYMARLQNSGAQFRPPDGFVRGRLDNLYGFTGSANDDLGDRNAQPSSVPRWLGGRSARDAAIYQGCR